MELFFYCTSTVPVHFLVRQFYSLVEVAPESKMQEVSVTHNNGRPGEIGKTFKIASAHYPRRADGQQVVVCGGVTTAVVHVFGENYGKILVNYCRQRSTKFGRPRSVHLPLYVA